MAANVVFDKSAYSVGDTIGFQVVVDQAMISEITLSGTVETPDGTVLPATSTTTISGVYGPFTAPGYTVTQDKTDPSKFTAVPAA